MADVSRIIARMQGQIAELQRRQTNAVRTGRVVDVDPANQRVKVDVGDEDNPLITPWIRWPERAGARKTWNPPSAGELMTVLSPAGEVDEKSLAMHGGFTNDNAAPTGEGDVAVFSFGAVTVAVKDDGATISVAETSMHIDASGVQIIGDVNVSGDLTLAGDLNATGSAFTHNKVNVGQTHSHTNVQPGSGISGPPN